MATHDRPDQKAALAARAWSRLFDFFISTRGSRDDTLQRFGLTPNDAKALHTLEANEGKPMSVLAEVWGTDRSNATWVVDRLERLGMAERRTITTDRRVKLVVLTSRGGTVREEIRRAFHEPPPELLALDRQDLRMLAEILGKVAPRAGQHRPPMKQVVARKGSGRRPSNRAAR
jgi:DNA-binding MarR family transcriptional regulator